MDDDIRSFVWPSASTLVRRAERSLNIVRSVPPATEPAAGALSVETLADLEARMIRFEQGYWSLVPPGFESAGRLASGKRFMKRVVRKVVWWYVEPRWAIQRDVTADLAGFATSSIQVMRAMSAELHDLRSKVDQMERRLAGDPE